MGRRAMLGKLCAAILSKSPGALAQRVPALCPLLQHRYYTDKLRLADAGRSSTRRVVEAYIAGGWALRV